MRVWTPAVLLVSIAAALAVSGLNPLGKAAKPYASSEEFAAYLDERIPSLMELYDIPGSSIALVGGGELVWSGAYGYADVASGRKLTADTPMRVQSISKPVTAWGVMKLAEQGKLELDAPVGRYLKNWQFPPSHIPAERITVRQLLSHTAGLPLGDVFTIYSPREKMPSLAEKLTEEAIPLREPGGAFSYSNTGYNLLELLIEEVAGEDFAAYMEREILVPLGMNGSAFVWSEAFDPAVPVGYDLNRKPVPAYVYPEKGSGGLFSTAGDIAAFTVAGMGNSPREKQVLGPGSIEALYTPVSRDIGVYGLVFDGYGLGHYMETLADGKQAVSHGGQGTGIMTHFHSVPETGDAIVILTNSQRSWPFISYLLGDWARWRGLGPVGMGRIIWGKYLLCAAIGLIWSAVLLQAARIAARMGNKGKERRRQKSPKLIRITQAGAAVVIMSGLLWCLNQKYLFLSSIFPRASAGLGISAAALSVILFLSALLAPRRI